MKSFHIKFAIVSCTLALAACGAGETETDKASIDEVGGSAYQQALGADGDVDCSRIHDVLWDHGIDPAQLEPDFVFEACLNSGTADDVCQVVAYTCFGDQGCTEPHPPQPQPPQECEELYQLVADDVDPADVNPDEIFERCLDLGYDDDFCDLAYQCFEVQPEPEPQPEPVCEEVRQIVEASGIDPADLSEDELLNLCLDQNYGEDECHALLQQCFGEPEPVDPPSDDCDDVRQRLLDIGIDLAQDIDPQIMYEQCIQVSNDEALCQAALSCY